MIFFPLKWLPWLLAICGFIALVTTGEPIYIVSTLIGVVWLVFIYNGKKGGTSTSSTSQKSLNNNSVNNTPKQTTINTQNVTNSANSNLCPNCKTPVGDGMSFCSKCGTKVR
jgi:hypothetical protein